MRYPSNNTENVINKRTVYLSYEITSTSHPVQKSNKRVFDKYDPNKRVYNKRTYMLSENDSIKNNDRYMKFNFNETPYNNIDNYINKMYAKKNNMNPINKNNKRQWKNK